MAAVLAVDLGGSGSRARVAGAAGACGVPGAAGTPDAPAGDLGAASDAASPATGSPDQTGDRGASETRRVTGDREVTGDRLRVAAGGLVAAPLVTALVDRLGLRQGDVAAVCVGSSGILTLSDGPMEILAAVRARLGRLPTVVASDAVTSTVGALGGRPGAVVLTGTGSTALGTDLDRTWRKVDGWGHVLGDAGSGSWIGMRALQAALEQHDGRRDDAAALLAAARVRFGEPAALVRAVHTREDRAGLLASFATDVVGLAQSGDDVAGVIVAVAGRELARSLAAALRPPVPPRASYTGGLFGAGEVLTGPFTSELARLRPGVVLEPPQGGSLDGAELLARRALTGDLKDAPPLLTVHWP